MVRNRGGSLFLARVGARVVAFSKGSQVDVVGSHMHDRWKEGINHTAVGHKSVPNIDPW